MITQKAQIISMDFIMTFVVFMLCMSVFFIGMRSSLSADEPGLDVSAELMFSRLDQGIPGYDFLNGSRIDSDALDHYLSLSGEEIYNQQFIDFNLPSFKRIDYCVYIERKSGNSRVVERSFGAGKEIGYSINFNNSAKTSCYDNPDSLSNSVPICTTGDESIILAKPVFFADPPDDYYANLKVFICATK